MNLVYELLAMDPAEKTRCDNPVGLLHLVRGFSKLWKAPKVSEEHCRITDGDSLLAVTTAESSSESEDDGRSFIIALEGPFDEIEPRREPLAAFLKDQEFEFLYVLRDQVSEQIACSLYPHLYRVENLLRGYLIRFMVTHLGPDWWALTASAEMTEKANMRKKNERVFGKHIESSAYLIDFDELGQIVYEQCSGFLTREDIVHRIGGLAETPEEIRKLKKEMQSNYQKLFKESFADKDFKEKWKQFALLRNKIAHNNLFTAEDLSKGKLLAKELTEMISSAEAETTKIVITSAEREAIKEQMSSKTSSLQPNDLTEEGFCSELGQVESEFDKRNMFVGLTYFLNNVLARKGYSYFRCRELVNQLSAAQRIEIYHVPHNSDANRQTAAIRRTGVNIGNGDRIQDRQP